MIAIAVANRKGGVGKTTTAYHLAVGLALRHRVLALDLDPQQDLCAAFGAAPCTEELLLDALRGKHTLQVAPTQHERCTLAPGGRFRDAEVAFSKLDRRRLYAVLAEVGSEYDYLIIDCPPLLGALTRNALDLADHVVIPVQPEVYGLLALRETLAFLRVELRRPTDHVIILPVMVAATTLHQDLIRDIERAVGKQYTIAVAVPRTIRLAETAARDMPIWVLDPGSDAATAYRILVNLVKRITR